MHISIININMDLFVLLVTEKSTKASWKYISLFIEKVNTEQWELWEYKSYKIIQDIQ